MDDLPASLANNRALSVAGKTSLRTRNRRGYRRGGDEFDGDYIALPSPQATLRQTTSEITLGQVLNALWRSKGTVVGAMLLLAFAFYIAAALMAPKFGAQGVLAIDPRPTYLPQLGSAMPTVAPDPTTVVRSEAQILNSRELLADVARKLQLDKDPEFNEHLREKTVVQSFGEGLGNALTAFNGALRGGASEDISESEAGGENETWSKIVSKLSRDLGVYTDGKSWVIYVNFEGRSRRTSAMIVNTVMETFIAKQIEYSATKSMETNAWIKQRATTLKQEVEAADQQVQDYRSKHGLLQTRMGTVSNQQLNELNTQLSLARSDRAQSEARFREAQDNSRAGSTGDATEEVLLSPLIQRLREREAVAAQTLSEVSSRLGPQHPAYRSARSELSSVRSQIEREVEKVLQSLQKQVEIARSRERNLDQQMAGLQGREIKMAGAEMELQQLTKEAETKRNVYQEFLATAQQTAEPSRIGLTVARIVSKAVPPARPSGLGGAIYALIGMFTGFLLASAWILLMGDKRRGFESADEIEAGVALPVLGVLPVVRSFFRRDGVLTQEVKRNPSSPTAETLRGVLVAMRNGQAQRRRPQVVLVTSAMPGEGKTSLAGALGVVAAMDGARVLIVDSDIRRPRMGRTFCRNGLPKLSDVLRGDEPLSSAVYRDKKYHVDCLIADGTDHSPAALVMSGHWQTLLDEARKTYDLIILDSSPVMKVADALCLADHADAVVMVVAQHSTRQKVVREALRRIIGTRAPLAGIVLSKANGTKAESQPNYSGYGAHA